MPVPDELPDRAPVALGVLVSGEGSLLEGLQTQIIAGRLAARIALVASDRPSIPALDRAARLELPYELIGRPAGQDLEWSRRVGRALELHHVELVVLDGFLSILPKPFVRAWPGRILNIHPSLLPRYGGMGFYGRKVHEAVLASGDHETGATVHWVTDSVDEGGIIVQRTLPVLPGDTPESLRERLRPVEIIALTEAISRWTSPATRVRDDSVEPTSPK